MSDSLIETTYEYDLLPGFMAPIRVTSFRWGAPDPYGPGGFGVIEKVVLPSGWDPNEGVGEWFASLPHEVAEFDGYEVPVYALAHEPKPNGRSVWGYPWNKAFKRKGSR